ncbi:hypothetical protein ACFL37_00735 [Candidatus Margulisiibacteriota bacterium]
MVEKTLNRIRSIEAGAAKIIEQANRAAALALIKNREQEAAEIGQAETAAKRLKAELSQAAAASARAEIQEIESRSKKEIKAIREKALTKVTSAKKEVLRCLS